MFKIIRALSLRQKLFVLTIVFIPYSAIYLFGNPYLFLPMVLFIGYFSLSINQLNVLFTIKGAERFFYPWIILWFLMLLAMIVNFLPEYLNIYRSILQRRIIYLVFFIVAFNEFRRRPYTIEIIEGTIVFSVAMMAVFYFLGIGVQYYGERLSLFGAGVNAIGVWTVFGIIIAMNRIVQSKLKLLDIIIYGGVILGAFLVMASTGSRKAIVMLAVGVTIYFIFLNTTSSLKIKLIIPFLILGFYGFNYIASNAVFQARFQQELESQSLGGRLPIWQETLVIIMDNPLIGAGPGLTREELTESSLGRSRAAHNEFLTIGSLAGIPGVLVFIYFLLQLGIRAYRTGRASAQVSSLPLVFWVIAIMYLSSAGGALNSFTTWFLFAYIAGKTQYKSIPKINFKQAKMSLNNKIAIK